MMVNMNHYSAITVIRGTDYVWLRYYGCQVVGSLCVCPTPGASKQSWGMGSSFSWWSVVTSGQLRAVGRGQGRLKGVESAMGDPKERQAEGTAGAKGLTNKACVQTCL